MLARVFALLPLALLVAADQQCVTGTPNCCNTSGPANSPAIASKIAAAGVGGLIGQVIASVDAVVFADCTGVVGTGSDCSQTPVCCEHNYSGGISVTCSPVKVL